MPSSHTLFPSEVVTCIQTISLEVSEHSHERQKLVCVGTALLRGPDLPSLGNIYVFAVIPVVPEPDLPETGRALKLIAKEEVKGAVTSVSGIGSQGFLLVAQGQKCMVRGLKEDGTLLPVAFLDMQCYVSVVRELEGTGLCLMGDAVKGVWFCGYTVRDLLLLLPKISSPPVISIPQFGHMQRRKKTADSKTRTTGGSLPAPPLRQISPRYRSGDGIVPPVGQAALHCRRRRGLQHPYFAIRPRAYVMSTPSTKPQCPIPFPSKQKQTKKIPNPSLTILENTCRSQIPLRPPPRPPHHLPHPPLPLNHDPPPSLSPNHLPHSIRTLPPPNVPNRRPRPPHPALPRRPPLPLEPAVPLPDHAAARAGAEPALVSEYCGWWGGRRVWRVRRRKERGGKWRRRHGHGERGRRWRRHRGRRRV